MEEYSFEALGTEWSLLSDGQPFTENTLDLIHAKIASFEERFSRFKETSEVNAFRQAQAGVYTVSDELAILLARADTLRVLTGGHYDPAAGILLEHYGYDKDYSFTQSEGRVPSVPDWSLVENQLRLSGATVFDLGGIGKGYAIDMIASILREQGYAHFLVDGGGDMYATTKANGSPYTIALEWPGKPEVSYGTVELRNQGLAVSDRVTRRFGHRHHIVDALKGENSTAVLGVVALGESAWDADCATSVLMQWPNIDISQIEEELNVETIVITEKEEFLVSPRWSGEIFTAH